MCRLADSRAHASRDIWLGSLPTYRCYIGNGKEIKIYSTFSTYTRYCGHSPIGNHLFCIPFIATEWHILDEANVHITILGEFDKVAQLVGIEVVHHDAIDFGLEAKLNGQIDAGNDTLESFASRNLFVFHAIQCVQADIEGI